MLLGVLSMVDALSAVWDSRVEGFYSTNAFAWEIMDWQHLFVGSIRSHGGAGTLSWL